MTMYSVPSGLVPSSPSLVTSSEDHVPCYGVLSSLWAKGGLKTMFCVSRSWLFAVCRCLGLHQAVSGGMRRFPVRYGFVRGVPVVDSAFRRFHSLFIWWGLSSSFIW